MSIRWPSRRKAVLAATMMGVGAASVREEQEKTKLEMDAARRMGARDASECLALQLRERNRLDPAMRALLGRLDLVEGEREVVAGIRLLPTPGHTVGSVTYLVERLCGPPPPGPAHRPAGAR